MSYLWIPAIAITVTHQHDRLLAFKWQDQTYQVIFISEQWRVDVEWWRVRVWRDYYRLVTDNGYLMVIYQDLHDQAWYLQQLYD